ncbi:MAG: hypothetical protein ACXAD7_08465, partial [Candidatus Kariarchaeaceae archaeon]
MVRDNDELKLSINKLVRKNQLMEIAELVAPFFKLRKKDEEGNPARFISVKDVQFNQIVKENHVEFDVTIHLLSDQGGWLQNVIIREFTDSDSFNDELTRYSTLEKRCFQFSNVTLLPMINIDQNNFRIVYEKQKGFTIYQLGLSQRLADFTLGQLAAILQGNEGVNIDQKASMEIFHFLLSHLPFTLEERESIMNLLAPHMDLLSRSNGGYYPCTLFDPYELQFIPLQDKDSITMEAIANKGAILAVLLIQTPENLIIDRMTDVATIFSQRAFNEFRYTGDVLETKQSITN